VIGGKEMIIGYAIDIDLQEYQLLNGYAKHEQMLKKKGSNEEPVCDSYYLKMQRLEIYKICYHELNTYDFM